MTLTEKYDELKAQHPRGGVIFKHVGIQNEQGGWLVEPMNDPDHDFDIPMLRFFAVTGNQKQQQQRIHDIVHQGWQPFKPEPYPEPVKRSSTSSSGSSTQSTRTRSSAKSSDK